MNGANTLTIRQGGSGNNLVEVVRQTQLDGQVAQFATVEQIWTFNRVALIDQLASSNVFEEDNVITVRMTGVRSGQVGLSDYAAQPIVTDSGIVQEGGNGDGWDILSGLVAFALAVVSTGIQIRFSCSALFGFYFFIWHKRVWKVVS